MAMGRAAAGSGLHGAVSRIVTTHASDIARIPDRPVTGAEIESVLEKTSFAKLERNNILEAVPQPCEEPHTRLDGRKVSYYRVVERVREQVAEIDQPQLECGCTGFTNTAEGYECSCGRVYDRETVVDALELSVRGDGE